MTARRAAAALALLALGPALPGCGKKGAPLPPLRVRPAPVEGLKARQRGESVVLTMSVPKDRTDGSALGDAPLLRLTLVPGDEASSPASKRPRLRRRRGPEQAASEGISWIVPRSDWPEYRRGERLEIPIPVKDLQPAARAAGGAAAGRRVAFLAEVQEGKRWRSAPAGPASLTLCDPPPAPAAVEARLAAAGIQITWRGAAAGSTANVYRAPAGESFPERPHRSVPAGQGRLLDEAPPPGVPLAYHVRLGAGPEPQRCESAASGEVVAAAVDLFPPAPPEGLAAAAEDSLIRLFWTPGPESDLTGYVVYRSDGPDEPFLPLTPSPIAETSFADDGARQGRRYTYVVSAVDGARPPNESRWSAPASEALP